MHIQLHDPDDNMATRCPDCCGWHDYRNSSVGQFELDVSDMFPGSHSKWMHVGLDRDSIFCVPLSATGACSARHQREDTNTMFTTCSALSLQLGRPRQGSFIVSNMLDCFSVLLYLWTYPYGNWGC